MLHNNPDGSVTTGVVIEGAKQYGDILVVMSYEAAAMRGLIEGASSFSSNGDYTTVGAVTDFPVHEAGAVNISLAGAQMSFVSSNANDTAAGTGLRTVAMGYIDAGLQSKTEVITMNGTTPVLSVATNVRFINSLTMLSAGSSGKNVGAITVTNGGLTYGAMSIGHRVQASSYRMVPFGKVFVPHEIFASSNSAVNQAAQAWFHIVNWSQTIPFWLPSNAIGCVDGPIQLPLKAGRPIPAGSIIGIETTTDKAAHVTASIIGHLENA